MAALFDHDLFDDPHLQQSGGLLDITLPDGKQTKIPGLPITIDGRRVQIRHDLPRIGQHSREILEEAGFTTDEIAEMISDGVVLSGD